MNSNQSPSNHNQILFSRIKNLVATERRIGVEILECLHEIEKRKAYAELKYDGLFTYCVKELSFTDSQAYQRIQAMRALKEIPELKPMIAAGSLNVSSVAKVQSHIRKERKMGVTHSKSDKLAIFELMENQTSKQVDQKLAEMRGEKMKMELHLELDEEAEVLWKRVKSLSAHKTQSDELNTLKMLMEDWIKKNDPLEKQRTVPSSTKVTGQKKAASLNPSVNASVDRDPMRLESKSNVRYIPTPLRRKIWVRDGGRCTQCGGIHALQIDHILPFAKNGATSEDNLRVLCRSCNLNHAIRDFGLSATRRV